MWFPKNLMLYSYEKITVVKIAINIVLYFCNNFGRPSKHVIYYLFNLGHTKL